MTHEPVKTARLNLTGDFAGIWVEIQRNAPMRVYQDFASGEIGKIIAALAKVTRSTNLTDATDAPIDLRSVDGWLNVSGEFVGEVAIQLRAALEPPKETSSGSATPTLPEAEPSPVTTTT